MERYCVISSATDTIQLLFPEIRLMPSWYEMVRTSPVWIKFFNSSAVGSFDFGSGLEMRYSILLSAIIQNISPLISGYRSVYVSETVIVACSRSFSIKVAFVFCANRKQMTIASSTKKKYISGLINFLTLLLVFNVLLSYCGIVN